MKHLSLTGVVFLFCIQLAYADDAGFIFGLKAGQTNFGLEEYKDDTVKGGLIGINFGHGIAVELDATSGDGELNVLGVQGDYNFNTKAIYLAYRSEGSLYFKIKGGWLHEEIEVSILGIDADMSDSDFSAGIGGGYRFGSVALEGEYTMVESDLDVITVGLNFYY